MLLHHFLKARVRTGCLAVAYADGSTRAYGDGSGEPVAVRVTRRGELRIVLAPILGIGEAYMEADLSFDRGDVTALLNLIAANLPDEERIRPHLLARVWIALVHRLRQANDRARARRNVAHHYDLSLDLYRRFLDQDLQYSCAYFAHDGMSLEAAQAAKKAHIAAKLRLEPGLRVLDIGCGWGGLALSLARDHGVEVLGVTLSVEQLATARARAEAAGLARLARFALCDYRDLRGQFDRIVSVGMFEHVGQPNYLAFFDHLHDRLTPDGIALIHSIVRRDPPNVTDPFIRKYHLPRRLYSSAVGDHRCDRAQRPVDHRHRDPAPALCRDAAPLARALRRRPGRNRPDLRRAVLPHVGILSGGQRVQLPARAAYELPAAADPPSTPCR